MSGMTARIDRDIYEAKWNMSITNHNATAYSWAQDETYVLGLHTWTVLSDHR